MALRWQQFNLLFNGGRDAKSDSKNIPLNQFEEMKNVYQQKTGKITKRNGYENLGNSIYDSSDTVLSPLWQGTYKKELLTVADGNSETGKELYSYSTAQNEQIRKGPIDVFDSSVEDIQTSPKGQSNVDSIVNGSIQITAWVDDFGIRYSAYDIERETVITSENTIADAGTSQLGIFKVSLSKAGNFVFILYISSVGASSAVKCAIIDIADPSILSSVTTIDTGLVPSGIVDIVEYASDACVFVYPDNVLNNYISIGFIKTDGTVGDGTNGYPAKINYTTAFNQIYLFSLAIQPNTNEIYIAYAEQFFSGTNHTINMAAFNGSTLANSLPETNVYTRNTPETTSNIVSKISLIFKEEAEAKIVIEEKDVDYKGFADDQLKRCTLIECTDLGSVTNTTLIKNRCQMLTDPFLFDGNLYVNLGYLFSNFARFNEAYQMTGFTVRLDDNVEAGAYRIVGKFLNSQLWYTPNYLGRSIAITSGITSYETGKFRFSVFTITGRIKFDLDEINQDNTKITLVEIDLDPDKKIMSAEQNGVLLLTGSDLLVYDGTVVNELGFHIYPDYISVNNDLVEFNVEQQGSASLPEITDITLIAGSKISDGQRFYIPEEVRFTVDDLTLSGTLYDVYINSYDSAIDVAKKVEAELNTGSDFTAVEAPSGYPTIRVTRSANGVTTDPTAPLTFLTTGYGKIEDGTYQYKAIYEWEDSQGNIYRSAPSPTTSITLSAGSAVNSSGINIPSLQFTRKYQYINGVPIADVKVVIYRTEANGSIFYRIGDQRASAFPTLVVTSYTKNFISQPWIGFHDITPDSLINTNEILYTQGGAVANINPPTPNALTSYRNRIVLGGFAEFPNEIWFSKELVTQEGINFNDTFIKKIDPFGGPVKALTMMDEKLIVFEENATLYLLGTGPDDLGLNETLTDAEFISRDAGTSEPNSVSVIFGQGGAEGVLFKSLKGWYRLNRGLGMDYVGSMVEDFNDSTVSKAIHIPNTHQVRIIHSDGDCLVYDHYYQQWYRWTNHLGMGACFFNGAFTYVRTNGETYTERNSGTDIFADDTTPVLVEFLTAWLQLSKVSGFQRIRKIMALGNFNDNFIYTWQFYFDHIQSSSLDVVNPTPVNNEETEIHLPRQKCKALQIAFVETSNTPDKGEAFELSSIMIETGLKRGVNKIADSGRSG